MYGGKREYKFIPPVCSLQPHPQGAPASVSFGESGEIKGIGKTVFAEPMKVQVLRAYLDNDMFIKEKWKKFEGYRQKICRKTVLAEGTTVLEGKLVKNCLKPLLTFTLVITPFTGGTDMEFSYKIAPYIDYMPRIGLEFALNENDLSFEYDGYGDAESYIDKHMSSEYGTYFSSAGKNYTHPVKPQESGSHFACSRLSCGGMTITAENPFSFNVSPYSTQMLMETAHDFALKETGKTYLNLDIAMSGVGTNSCGPELAVCYRAPKRGKNRFRIFLDDKRE